MLALPRPVALLLLLGLLGAGRALASDADCGWVGNHVECGHDSGGAAAGASAPLLGDTLDGNPAALPTEPTPFGLEGRWSNRAWPDGSSKLSGSTVKGFDGIGFGIGSWSDGEFSAPDFDNHFLGTTSEAAYQQYVAHPPATLGLRLGGAIVLPRWPLGSHIRVSVGGSAGLGRVKNDWSPQAGVMVRLFGLGLGASNSYEHIALSLPRITVTTFSVGLQLSALYFGYSRIILKSSANQTYANVLAVWISTRGWTYYGNLKTQLDHRGLPDSWTRAGIQRRLGKRIGIGYEYGMYRYSHTAVLQVFL